MSDTVKQAREKVIIDKKYSILKNIMEKDYYFDLLSPDAKYQFLFGKTKLTDILYKILEFSMQEKISEEDVDKFCICIKEFAGYLNSVYDAKIFFGIVLETVNGLDKINKEDFLKIKINILDFLKNLRLTVGAPSMKEKKALYSLAEVHEEMRLFFKNEVFLLSDAEVFLLSDTSGLDMQPFFKDEVFPPSDTSGLFGRLLTSSQKKDRIAARKGILSLAGKIREADQCNIFFELTGGEKDVYFSKNYKTNKFQIKNVLNDDIVLEETVVRKLPYNQSSLFGNLLFQATLRGEMDLEESKDMRNLFRARITNLFNMAKKGYVECLEYIIPLSYDVNIYGLEDRLLNISEIDGEDISNLGGIGKITVLELAKAYFNGEREVIEKLEYLERILEEYKTKGITAAMSVALGKEDEKMDIKSDSDEKEEKHKKPDKSSEETDDDDEKDEKCASTKGSNSEEESVSKFGNGEFRFYKPCAQLPAPRFSLLVGKSNEEESLMASSSSLTVVKERIEKRESAEKSRCRKRAEEIGEDRKKKDMCNIQ